MAGRLEAPRTRENARGTATRETDQPPASPEVTVSLYKGTGPHERQGGKKGCNPEEVNAG